MLVNTSKFPNQHGARSCGYAKRYALAQVLTLASYAERHLRAIVSEADSEALASVGRPIKPMSNKEQ